MSVHLFLIGGCKAGGRLETSSLAWAKQVFLFIITLSAHALAIASTKAFTTNQLTFMILNKKAFLIKSSQEAFWADL